MSETKKSLTTLTVDIDLRCRPGLDELLGYFGSSVAILRRTGDDASIELKTSHDSLDEELLHVAALVQAFPVEGQKLWHQCDLRRINLWIHVRREPRDGVMRSQARRSPALPLFSLKSSSPCTHPLTRYPTTWWRRSRARTGRSGCSSSSVPTRHILIVTNSFRPRARWARKIGGSPVPTAASTIRSTPRNKRHSIE